MMALFLLASPDKRFVKLRASAEGASEEVLIFVANYAEKAFKHTLERRKTNTSPHERAHEHIVFGRVPY